MDYRRAIETVVKSRAAALDRAKATYKALLEKYPEFYANEKEIRGLELDAVMGKDVDGKKLAAAKKRRKKLLSDCGVKEADLDPPPSCPKCGDTGTVNGKICECALKLAIAQTPEVCDIPDSDFSDFDANLRKSPAASVKLVEALKILADKYPASKKRTVLLTGGVGVGKTFLAGCFANEIKKKGGSVVATTAFGFQNRMLSYHTAPMDKKADFLSPVLDCSLLIIDDLGKESLLKNVTAEYLYLVVNERLVKGAYTFITTNLTPAEISARYGESIYSRLFSDSCLALSLAGEDLRLMKNKKS